MTAPCSIIDAKTGSRVTVTKYGQLVTSAVDYSVPVAKSLLVIDTAVNFIRPVADHAVVITDIIITANKDVGIDGATIVLYESTEADSLSSAEDILNIQMLKQTILPLTGLNLIVPEGYFINAKTNDNDVFITLMYYRVPVGVI